jgi:3-isopropylmalate dehydrogenase
MEHSIAVLAGDGVGPEIIAEGMKILRAVEARFNHKFTFHEAMIGAMAFGQLGEALPAATIETCKNCDAVLFGAVGDPKFEKPGVGSRPEPGYGFIRLRKTLGLFANIRPVYLFPSMIESPAIKREVIEGVDLMIIRELTGGIYFGEPKQLIRDPSGRRAVDSLVYSEEEIARIVRVGFEMARRRRKKLTSVDKFQILRSSDLWREVANEVSQDYSDVTLEHAMVDSCAMRLVTSPRDFDVLVTENLFGDILSDVASVLAGSLGMVPSASLADVPKDGKRVFGLYEPIHGSAPTLAGRYVANPIATIMSAAMMLRYSFGLAKEAERVETAVKQVLEAGYRTQDIMSKGKIRVGTKEMGDLIEEIVRNGTA